MLQNQTMPSLSALNAAGLHHQRNTHSAQKLLQLQVLCALCRHLKE
jgi:hypothetical protein